MTVQELTRQFAERLRRADRQSAVDGSHTGPCYPMTVLTLGGRTRTLNHALQYGLRQLWPPYWTDIAFVDTFRRAGGVTFTNPGRYRGEDAPSGSEVGAPEALTAEGLGEMTEQLFRVGTHFIRANRILLYAVLDTADFQSPDELLFWLDALEAFQASIDNVTPVLTSLSILFHENTKTARRQAEQIRAKLGECLDSHPELPAVLLISNRRSDSLIDSDGTLCRALLTAFIAVSNNEDAQVVQELFQPGTVMAASYARAEKPVEEISRICVDQLLDELNNFTPSGAGDLFGKDAERTRERLGLSPDGTFRVLDGYVERHLARYVPEGEALRELLRAFPLAEPDTALSDDICGETSSARIDELTFGAWNCYLESAVGRARDGIQDSQAELRTWRREYADFLRRRFYARELMELSRERERIEEFAEPVNRFPTDTSVRETAGRRLKYLLSSDPEIREQLFDEIEEAGKRAEAFVRAWGDLMRTRSQLPDIRRGDETFIRYYTQNLRAFFDSYQMELRERFRTIPDVEGLTDFFHDVLDRIFENRTLRNVFAATFEDVGAMQIEQTRATLTGADVPVYFATGFSMDAPLASFLLLNVDESGTQTLYRTLKDGLPDPEKTRFYHTGRGSAAESLNIFRLQRFHLWSGDADADDT